MSGARRGEEEKREENWGKVKGVKGREEKEDKQKWGGGERKEAGEKGDMQRG